MDGVTLADFGLYAEQIIEPFHSVSCPLLPLLPGPILPLSVNQSGKLQLQRPLRGAARAVWGWFEVLLPAPRRAQWNAYAARQVR